MAAREWTLRRNCSLSPRQLTLFYASLCVASLTIAGLFAFLGAPYVLVFALFDLSAVGCAFLVYARHAADRERIALDGDRLLVELIEVERVRRFCLVRHLTQVELPSSRHPLVALEAGGTRVLVGRFVTERKRREFAQELKRELRRGLAAGG